MIYKYTKITFILVLSILFWACSNENQSTVIEFDLFSKIGVENSGLTFFNFIRENHIHNIFNFDYMYNGGGVAIGDINNDGLPDVYFSGNMADNKLFLNKGNLKFQDITNTAQVNGENSWSNGVSMVDINNDGFLDIYVCRSFYPSDIDKRKNLLYVNQGNMQFKEMAELYGLADSGHSIHSCFFDYDNDGDLDAFIINHPDKFKISGRDKYSNWKNPNLKESNKLYSNNGDFTFSDVTQQSGIIDYAFSLGIVTQDFDSDGFLDIFISNDYAQPDQYLRNNGDGTFSNLTNSSFKHISNFGMGVDALDINADGLSDIVTVDMLSNDNYREKTMMGSMSPAVFWTAVEWGYNYQYMRNSLHLNNGKNSFSEIGQLANIHRTDWSWAPLLADYDHDGNLDLYVTNGFLRDTRNKDIRKKNDSILLARGGNITPVEIEALLNAVPSTKVSNYLFLGNENLTFDKVGKKSGMDIPSFSHGAAYADLDNDGDLDLVVNNLLDTAFLYRNNTMEHQMGNYLKINFEKQINPIIGTSVSIYSGTFYRTQQFTPCRGYLSSVEPMLHFGLGAIEHLDSIVVKWPNNTIQNIGPIKSVNRAITVAPKNTRPFTKAKENITFFNEVIINDYPKFSHKENHYDDYKTQVLLPHKMSQFGPCLAVADLNNDGLEDFYIGGAKGQLGKLFFQNKKGFTESILKEDNPKYEDNGVHFFDFDQDGDLDIYLISGGSGTNDNDFQDRLFINNGQGDFSIGVGVLPQINSSGSKAVSADFDQDGDLDLFVAGRHLPGNYPLSPKSYLLENKNGSFVDITEERFNTHEFGMITSVLWHDLKKDGFPDLILAGEWTGIKVYANKESNFEEVSKELGFENTNGWWNDLELGDFNNDGVLDLVAGNLGLNYKYKATKDNAFHLYSNDFDKNGSSDIVLAFEQDANLFPVRGRECSSQQMPSLKKAFPNYNKYGSANLDNIYGTALKDSKHFLAQTFETSIFLYLDGKFIKKELPQEAQFAPVNDMIIEDLNQDGNLDIIMAGNLYVSEVETGRADAGTGLILLGDGNGNFNAVRSLKSGFWADKDVKSLAKINTIENQKMIIVGNNNDDMQLFKFDNNTIHK